jgi:N-methylhydantoinase A/oxoprolinase/acetone carboxylase beta subunit
MTMLRIGIDVGGTFTDVVAIDAASGEIVERLKVPTTHRASEGVAAGIVDGLQQLLRRDGIDAARIAFIAHSTTQATNALLEGDVARVGIVGLHGKIDPFARAQMRVPAIRLGPQASLAPQICYASRADEHELERALDQLKSAGVEALAVSEAFGVDRPARERAAVERARTRGFHATSGHEVSSMYGLRARTRTAVLNAAILPTMLRTATMTAAAVEQSGIGAPLMIMRSDGGVMDVREVARRPILTMLSGPAAGIAGALLHENVTDGIFLEVGGTSTDCSVIRRGLPQMRPARIGGHRTMLRTLDVRTLAVAGGSLLRLARGARGTGAIRDVGPRSAHIAGLRYAVFTPRELFAGARVVFVAPQPGDPDDYVALELADGTRCAPTPTCAANLLSLVPESAFARGEAESARLAFAAIGETIGCTPEELAHALLERAAAKLYAAIDELIDDYELDRRDVELVGGGGGAAALVPFAAANGRFEPRVARDAEVISPVGVALALVRDVVERTIPNPTPDDVVRVRREAIERVVAAGAAPELVETSVEIDARTNLVRAAAFGASAAVAKALRPKPVGEAERLVRAARALRRPPETMRRIARTGSLEIYVCPSKRAFVDACVVDDGGVVRLIARDALVRSSTAAAVAEALRAGLDEATAFGDVGRALPEAHLVYGSRTVTLGTLAEADQVVALAEEELAGLDAPTPVQLILQRVR